MSHLIISKKNEVYLQVKAEPHVYYELADQFTFDVPGAKFMPQYRNKYWDGKIRLFNTQTGEIYVGLLDKLTKFVMTMNIPMSLLITNSMVFLLRLTTSSQRKVLRII